MMNVPLIIYAAQMADDDKLLEIGLTHSPHHCAIRSFARTARRRTKGSSTWTRASSCENRRIRDGSPTVPGRADLPGACTVSARSTSLTGRPEFLEVAERNAAFWLAKLPSDRIPWWDFRADLTLPPPWGQQKDSSAAAIAASGLLDLARQTPSENRARAYREMALAMLEQLAGPDYLADGTPGWEGILRHGVYHTSKNLGVDESVMWGDFFFVEALSKALATTH